MVLVLVLGDLHIPHRAHDLPAKFKKLLVPGKIQQILLTGNVSDQETYDYLRSIAPDIRGARGDWDENANIPASTTLQHGPIKIGIIHGHQAVPLGDSEALAGIARSLDVDMLISGATHKFEHFEMDRRLYVNPGSATGASMASYPFTSQPPSQQQQPQQQSSDEPSTSDTTASSSPPGPTPSFVLLDIQGYAVVCYVYTLVQGEVKVDKIEVRLQGRSLPWQQQQQQQQQAPGPNPYYQ